MSTIIKAGQSDRLRGRLAAVDLADHLRQAETMVIEAKRRAAEICEAAAEEARQLRARARSEAHEAGNREGYEKGYREGLEKGVAEGRREALESAMVEFQAQQATLVGDLSRIVAEFEAMKGSIRADAEEHVLEFALKLATKLTYAIGGVDQQAATANLGRAVELVHQRTDLTVRMHPDDVAAFEEMSPAPLEELRRARSVQLVPDQTLARGGCVVRSARTEIDASLETQLDEVVSLLLRRDAAGTIVECDNGGGTRT